MPNFYLSAARSGVAAAAALALLGLARPALATGMQGHIYMAQCAAEQTGDARLRAIFDASSLSLVNGTFFPDSGYTADDHDQGEVAHWEQYVQGYIEVIRERYEAPYDDPEAAAHIAFLMGIGAHGITDSTFDSLVYSRSEEVNPVKMDSFDLAMDVFLVHDMPRYFIPDYAFDAATLSVVYDKVPHAVPPENITEAMMVARSGIGALTELLAAGADDYGKRFPWARSHIFDSRTPGSYPFGARVVGRYYEEILRRIDGDTSADAVLIGSYPDALSPLVTLDASRADGKIVLFFGHGIDRSSITEKSVIVSDGSGNVVPTELAVFRGDKWANVITVKAAANWLPSTKYKVVLSKEIRTLNNASPSKDVELSFETCTPESPGGDCPEAAGPAPASLCPKTEAKYAERPVDMEEEPPANPPSAEASGGCGVASRGEGPGPWPLLLLILPAALRRRRAGHRRHART